MSNSGKIDHAARVISAAQVILIGAGAGMGVDSGLPDFRGNEGFWNAYPVFKELGLSFMDMANPDWFDKDPAFAWGFYGHRLNMYRDCQPHDGFNILKKWCAEKPHFIFTSNVDGQFQRAGFATDRVFECHGSIHYIQCSQPCRQDIWDIGNTEINVDEDACRVIGKLPLCKHCGAVARPNILMFNDWSWYRERKVAQSRAYHQWLAKQKGKKIVAIECGAGTAIPSVRMEMQNQAVNGTLIRINLRESQCKAGHIGLAMPALEALQAIDEAMLKA